MSVIGFFRRDRRGHGVWTVLVAPVLGAVGLLTAFAVIATNFELVSGMSGPINGILLATVPLVFAIGITVGIVMRRRSPERYAALTQSVRVVPADEEGE